MTRSFFARRGLAALLALAASLLTGCLGGGGGNSSGPAQWRILNLASDIGTVNVLTDTTPQFSSVAGGGLTGYQTIESGAYNVLVNSATGTNLINSSNSFTKDQHYTGVIWGHSGALGFATLPEDNDTTLITAGYNNTRIYNATSDFLDVFLTQDVTDITGVTPTISGVSALTRPGGYKPLLAGTYRLWVTTSGVPTDVRLVIDGVSLTASQYSTLIITAGPSGYLLNGALLVQQGNVTPFNNTSARFRVAAGADSNAVVKVQLGNTTYASLTSPAVNDYVSVPAGNTVATVTYGSTGNASNPQSLNLVAGTDYTLLAFGDTSTVPVLLTDDNHLPTTSTKYKVRLVNGIKGADPLTLVADLQKLAVSVPVGSDSAYGTGTGNTTTPVSLQVYSALSSTTYYSDDTVKLLPQGVYTIFMLGGNSTPTGKPSKDR